MVPHQLDDYEYCITTYIALRSDVYMFKESKRLTIYIPVMTKGLSQKNNC